MILEFMTKRNANGHRAFLIIDTDKQVFATDVRVMIPDYVEIKLRDMCEMRKRIENDGFKRVDFI